jgi:hypothetical protein
MARGSWLTVGGRVFLGAAALFFCLFAAAAYAGHQDQAREERAAVCSGGIVTADQIEMQAHQVAKDTGVSVSEARHVLERAACPTL